MFTLSDLITEDIRSAIGTKFAKGIANKEDLFFTNDIQILSISSRFQPDTYDKYRNVFFRDYIPLIFVTNYDGYKEMNSHLSELVTLVFNYLGVYSSSVPYKNDYYLTSNKIDDRLDKYVIKVEEDKIMLLYSEDQNIANQYNPLQQSVIIEYVEDELEFIFKAFNILYGIKNTKYFMTTFSEFTRFISNNIRKDMPYLFNDYNAKLDALLKKCISIAESNMGKMFEFNMLNIIPAPGNDGEGNQANNYIGDMSILSYAVLKEQDFDSDYNFDKENDNIKCTCTCDCKCSVCTSAFETKEARNNELVNQDSDGGYVPGLDDDVPYIKTAYINNKHYIHADDVWRVITDDAGNFDDVESIVSKYIKYYDPTTKTYKYINIGNIIDNTGLIYDLYEVELYATPVSVKYEWVDGDGNNDGKWVLNTSSTTVATEPLNLNFGNINTYELSVSGGDPIKLNSKIHQDVELPNEVTEIKVNGNVITGITTGSVQPLYIFPRSYTGGGNTIDLLSEDYCYMQIVGHANSAKIGKDESELSDDYMFTHVGKTYLRVNKVNVFINGGYDEDVNGEVNLTYNGEGNATKTITWNPVYSTLPIYTIDNLQNNLQTSMDTTFAKLLGNTAASYVLASKVFLYDKSKDADVILDLYLYATEFATIKDVNGKDISVITYDEIIKELKNYTVKEQNLI